MVALPSAETLLRGRRRLYRDDLDAEIDDPAIGLDAQAFLEDRCAPRLRFLEGLGEIGKEPLARHAP